MAFFDGVGTSLASTAGDIISNVFANSAASNAASDARDWQGDFYNRQQADSSNANTQSRIFQQQMQQQQAGYGTQFQKNAFEYQKSLSDTSYQRAVGDLRSAGLNPMLAIMKGGASSPSVGVPSVGGGGSGGFRSPGGSSGPVAQVFKSNAASAFMATQEAQARIKLLDSQSKDADASAALRLATIPKVDQEVHTGMASAGALGASRDKMLAEVRRMSVEVTKLRQDTATSRAQELLHDAQRELTRPHADLAIAQAHLAHAHAALTGVQSVKERYGLPRARQEMRMWAGPAGKFLPYLDPVARIGGAVGAGFLAKKILGGFDSESRFRRRR